MSGPGSAVSWISGCGWSQLPGTFWMYGRWRSFCSCEGFPIKSCLQPLLRSTRFISQHAHKHLFTIVAVSRTWRITLYTFSSCNICAEKNNSFFYLVGDDFLFAFNGPLIFEGWLHCERSLFMMSVSGLLKQLSQSSSWHDVAEPACRLLVPGILLLRWKVKTCKMLLYFRK